MPIFIVELQNQLFNDASSSAFFSFFLFKFVFYLIRFLFLFRFFFWKTAKQTKRVKFSSTYQLSVLFYYKPNQLILSFVKTSWFFCTRFFNIVDRWLFTLNRVFCYMLCFFDKLDFQCLNSHEALLIIVRPLFFIIFARFNQFQIICISLFFNKKS